MVNCLFCHVSVSCGAHCAFRITSDVYYSTLKSFYHVQHVYSCAQVLVVVIEGTGSDVAHPDESDGLKGLLFFPIIPCKKNVCGA